MATASQHCSICGWQFFLVLCPGLLLPCGPKTFNLALAMISFYPGPSRLDDNASRFMAEACQSGILSVNHRSPRFVELMRKTVSVMRQKLAIPANYHIFFTSSATECWQIIAESFINRPGLHLFNGAFGEKWYQYRMKISPNALPMPFHYNRLPGLNQLANYQQAGVVCLTQNETSNGTQLRNRRLRKIKGRLPGALLCVDATSSMAGVALDWEVADVWFASVQKCFGLPAGLGVMVCSPRAVEASQQDGLNRHYNSLAFMAEKMEAFQTTHTPNMLGIYLLCKVLQQREDIARVERKLKARMLHLNERLMHLRYQLLVTSPRLRSFTVTAIKAAPEAIDAMRKAALSAGIMPGNGYGTWKDTTLRFANFPAITDAEFEQLHKFLDEFRIRQA